MYSYYLLAVCEFNMKNERFLNFIINQLELLFFMKIMFEKWTYESEYAYQYLHNIIYCECRSKHKANKRNPSNVINWIHHT